MVEWVSFWEGFIQLLSWQTFLYMSMGVVFGIICGAIPGFSASMAVVILLPITFSMPPLMSMVLLCSVYVSSVYGGSITAILLNTPGTANSAATAFDGYPMTVKGQANEALGLCLGSSCIGGIISYFLMLFAMYPIAAFAVKFGSPEMFMLAIFGLTIIGTISDRSFSKAMLAGFFGIFISTVGASPTGSIRAHFGSSWLLDGLPAIPSIIGFFAFAEMFNMITKEYITEDTVDAKRSLTGIMNATFHPFKHPVNLIRSSLIGSFIGAVPAAGGTIASFIGYKQAKEASKDKASFGKGNPDGIIASESANNASTGGALMTMFALGIPGSATTAIMLGALMIQGLQPGPQLFMNQMPLVYSIIIALLLSQVIMWIAGVAFSYSLSGVLNISTKILVPVISVLSLLGAYALRHSLFDCFLVVIFGVGGYIMKTHDYPPIATVLGIILGPIADQNFIRMTIRYRGDYSVLVMRPISLVLVLVTVAAIVVPYILQKIREQKKAKSVSCETVS